MGKLIHDEKFYRDVSDLQDKMLEYALKKVIDSLVKNMQMTMKARKQAELAYQKAEIHSKAIKKSVKFGKLELPMDFDGAKYIIPIISGLFVGITIIQQAAKATDTARRLAGEVRRWEEKKDKVRLLRAEERKQAQFELERNQHESEYVEPRKPGRPRTRPVSTEPKRKPGRPKKV